MGNAAPILGEKPAKEKAGNGRQDAFSAVRSPFVRPTTAAQHFFADNDENGK